MITMTQKKIVFSITQRCQSRCNHCNIWQLRPVNELTLEEIETFARTNAGQFNWIDLTGGEPFLRSDHVDILKAFHKHNKLKYYNTTINSLMTKDFYMRKLEEIAQLGIQYTYVTISLDGPADLDAIQRGIPDHFKRATELGAALHELEKKYKNFHFMFGYTMTKTNQGHLIQTIEDTKKVLPFIDYKRFHLNLFQTSEIYYYNEKTNLAPDKEVVLAELNEYLKKRGSITSLIDIAQTMYFKMLKHFIITGKRAIQDDPFKRVLFLDNFGNIYPAIDWSFKAGNIRDNDAKGAFDLRQLEKVNPGKEPEFISACNDNVQLLDVGNFMKVLML